MGAGVVKEPAGQTKPQSPSQSTSFSGSSGRPHSAEMSCDSCNVSFTVFKRKKPCSDCLKYHCKDCLRKEKIGSKEKARCAKCRLLNSGNFTRPDLQKLGVKDMRHFLQRRNVSTQNCREKDDLIELILSYSNNTSWRQQQEERRRHLEELQERKRQADANSRANLRQAAPPPPPGPDSPAPSPPPPRAAPPTEPTSNNSPSGSSISGNHGNPGGNHGDDPGVPPPSYGETTRTEVEDFVPEPEDQNSEPPTTDNNTNTEGTSQRGRASLEHVREVGDIEELTVRQLKEILATNFVDYKGCCEKWELMDRVKRLWEAHQHNAEQADELAKSDEPVNSKEDDLCKICMDAMIDCVLLECGHMVTCTQCGKRMSECPVCRQYVVRVVHIFKA